MLLLVLLPSPLLLLLPQLLLLLLVLTIHIWSVAEKAAVMGLAACSKPMHRPHTCRTTHNTHGQEHVASRGKPCPPLSTHGCLGGSLCVKQHVYPGAAQGTTRPMQ
jgi:hypothetical protein